ncbi:MAG: hypothetical protein AB8G96_08665 [Phycisphaerales bacterium]
MSIPRRHAALIAINAGLLGLLGLITLGPVADAQPRPRGRYVGVAGGVNGSEADAIWILDTANREMVALTWQPNQKALIGIGYRNVATDSGTAMTEGGR